MAAEIETESATQSKKPRLFAKLSASVVAAMSPLMREVHSFAYSDYAFFNQLPSEWFGSYILPAEKGVVVLAIDAHRFVAVSDPEGHTEEPLKIHLPDGLLDATEPIKIQLAHENASYERIVKPTPEYVHCSDGFGLVFGFGDSDDDGVCFGSWFNEDAGNVIRADSYRLEAASTKHLMPMLRKCLSADLEPQTEFLINPSKLSAILHLAKRLDSTLQISARGNVLRFASLDTGRIFGVVMPLQLNEAAETPVNHAQAVLETIIASQ